MWFDAHHASCSSLLETSNQVNNSPLCAPLFPLSILINYKLLLAALVEGRVSPLSLNPRARRKRTRIAAICAIHHASLSSIPNEREFHFFTTNCVSSLFVIHFRIVEWMIGQMDSEGCGWSKATSARYNLNLGIKNRTRVARGKGAKVEDVIMHSLHLLTDPFCR